MAIFAEVTENESIDKRHMRDTELAKELSFIFRPKLTSCSAVSLRQPSYLLFLCVSRICIQLWLSVSTAIKIILARPI